MSTDETLDTQAEDATDAENTTAVTDEHKMSLSVNIEDVGPCRKHVTVTVPRVDIDFFRSEAIAELSGSAQVPGFRSGYVPAKLLEKRFKTEIADQVKQKVLVISLEQLAEENDLDPINEPNLDVESIEIPEDGDFEYEFEVEVRPDFDLPDYAGLEIDRPTREVTDEALEAYKQRFLSQYAEREVVDAAAAANDYITAKVTVNWNDKQLAEWDDMSLCLKPTLRFQDAEISGFAELMQGVAKGDSKMVDVQVSLEAANIEMRGETVKVTFDVSEVRRLVMPEMTRDFFDRVDVESEEELTDRLRDSLERQITYDQRQSTREQVLAKITESADWDLPEELVLRQTENALRREMLEMQQAGFTTQQIQARENQMRSQAVSTTRQALKEHFVLDKIATKEDIDVLPSDIEMEVMMMSFQSGESPRRVRARLQKSGMIENLEAQIRERKAVDVVLQQAKFNDVPMEESHADEVEAVSQSICGFVEPTLQNALEQTQPTT